MAELMQSLGHVEWRDTWDLLSAVVDLVAVWYLIYRLLLLIKGTQAVQMLMGLAVLILLFIVSKEERLNLSTLNWILDKFIGAFVFMVIVIFQADLRRGLARLGRQPWFRSGRAAGPERYLEEVVQAASILGQKKIGALVAIERQANLDEYTEIGVKMDAVVTNQTLQSVFIPFKQNPLHDGAVIIRGGRVVAARCILPFTGNPRYASHGSRHRAAVGLSELKDAMVVVVSEETGAISLAVHGELTTGLDANSLRLRLAQGFTHDVSAVESQFSPPRRRWWQWARGRRRRSGAGDDLMDAGGGG
jgi:diadenylate cyclase